MFRIKCKKNLLLYPRHKMTYKSTLKDNNWSKDDLP